MSARQPMGTSGVSTEIISGRPPIPKTLEERQAELELKEQKAQVEAIEVLQDLPGVLPIMATQFESRLWALAKQDPFCASYLKMFAAFRAKIDVTPRIISKMRRQAMGMTLANMTDETKVAPDRDTDLE